jgi:hypothetical protein
MFGFSGKRRGQSLPELQKRPPNLAISLVPFRAKMLVGRHRGIDMHPRLKLLGLSYHGSFQAGDGKRYRVEACNGHRGGLENARRLAPK